MTSTLCAASWPASPHFRPGPFAPNEDAVARLVRTLSGWDVAG